MPTSRFDRSLEDDWPVLHVPKDKAQYAEADSLQQRSERSCATTWSAKPAARRMATASWRPLPIQQRHASSEMLAIERALALPEDRGGDARSLTGQIWPYARVPGKARAAPAFTITGRHGGKDRHRADAIRCSSSCSMRRSRALMTALRMEVPPADPAKALHSPEKGFVANRIDAWVVAADGKARQDRFSRCWRRIPSKTARQYRAHAAQPAGARGAVARWRGWPPIAASWPIPTCSAPAGWWRVPMAAAASAARRASEAATDPERADQCVILAGAAGARAGAAAIRAGRLSPMRRSWKKTSRKLEDVERAVAGHPQRAAAGDGGAGRLMNSAPTLEFDRGSFLTQVGPALAADTPALFPKLPANAPRNRLTLAQMVLRSPDQPLTARVAVNRYWEAAVRHRPGGDPGRFRQRRRKAQPSGIAGLAGAAFPERPALEHEGAAARDGHQRRLPAERAHHARAAAARSAQPPAGAWPAAAPYRRDGARPGAAGQRAAQSRRWAGRR